MRHHRKLTDDERRQIIEGRANGTPADVRVRRFSVSRRTIYNTQRRPTLALSYQTAVLL